MLVRAASARDVEHIVGMQRKLMESHERYREIYKIKTGSRSIFGRHLRKILKDSNYAVYVAEEKNELIGYLIVSISALPPLYVMNKQALISDLFVEEGYRGRGIGVELIRTAEQWARKKKMHYIALETDCVNKPAIALYKKAGFEIYRHKMHKRV